MNNIYTINVNEIQKRQNEKDKEHKIHKKKDRTLNIFFKSLQTYPKT